LLHFNARKKESVLVVNGDVTFRIIPFTVKMVR